MQAITGNFHRLTYGLMSLCVLWAMGGGNWELLWQRQYLAAALMALFVAVTYFVEKKIRLLEYKRGNFRMGVGLGLPLGLAFVLVIFFLRNSELFDFKVLAPPSIPAALFFGMIFLPLGELFFGSILSKEWGLWNVAFLEAINFGFGGQNFGIFTLITLGAAASAWIGSKYGALGGSISRASWATMVFVALTMF